MRAAAAAGLLLLGGCLNTEFFRLPSGGSGQAGRQTMRWAKEGGSEQQFLRDRYECLKDSQEQRSRFAANRYAAGGSSYQVTDSGMFQACMNARGYVLDDDGPFAPPAGGEMLVQ